MYIKPSGTVTTYWANFDGCTIASVRNEYGEQSYGVIETLTGANHFYGGKYGVANSLQCKVGSPPSIRSPYFVPKSQSKVLGTGPFIETYSMYVPTSVALNPSAVTAEKLKALSALEDYRIRWLTAFNNTTAFIAANYTMRKQIISKYGLAGTPPTYGPPSSLWNERWNRSWAVSQYTETAAVVALCFDWLAEPNWISKELEIEAYYGNLMDAAQNAVLQQIINTDPDINWAGAIGYSVNLTDIFDVMLNMFWTGTEFSWENPYGFLDIAASDIEFIEEYPDVFLEDDLVIQLLDVKLNWIQGAVAVLDAHAADTGVVPPGFDALASALIGEMKRSLLRALRSRLAEDNVIDRVVTLAPTISSWAPEKVELLDLLISDNLLSPIFEDGTDDKTAQTRTMLLNTFLAGRTKPRPTIVITSPGVEASFDFPYRTLNQLPDVIQDIPNITSPREGVKVMSRALIPVMKEAAKGIPIVCAPGHDLLQTFVATPKSYGFNVVMHTATQSEVSSGLTKVKLMKRSALPDAVMDRLSAGSLADRTSYWYSLLQVSDEELARTEIDNSTGEMSFEKDRVGSTQESFAGFKTCRMSTAEMNSLFSRYEVEVTNV